ncbi:MAG TPA: hypothetical protein PLZ43_14105 [bacterium]|nr:hypothetical protein [bacterium]
MKHLFLLLIFIVLYTSCNENKPSNNNDTVGNPDSIAQTDSDSTADTDHDLITDIDPDDTDTTDETPDSDSDGCLPENIDAGYPYYRNDGSIHFCRACDKPTNNDPDCIANLWVDGNRKLFAEHPDKDCLGYPCMMDDLTPFYSGEREGYYLDKCDMMINANNPKGWQTGMVTFKHYNLSDGKVGLVMNHVLTTDLTTPVFKAVEFDIEKKSYLFVRPGTANDTLTYDKGAFFNTVWDRGLKEDDDSSRQYLVYSDSSGRMKVVYNKPVYFIVYNPIVSNNWVFVNIREVDGGPSEMKYAKIGEWKWRSLGNGIGYHPQIVGDKLALYVDSFDGHVCDLSKSPASLSSCLKVNRDGEEIRYAKMDEENSNLMYFSPVNIPDRIIRTDLSKTPIEYSEIKFEGLLETRFAIVINKVKGSMVLYSDISLPDPESDMRENRLCYYRTDLKKSFCSLATPHDEGKMEYRQAYGEFENHWLVWQDSVGPLMKVRDMECYCDYHPELCPFDDYTPQPENPKDVKTGKRPSEILNK